MFYYYDLSRSITILFESSRKNEQLFPFTELINIMFVIGM